MVRGRFDRITLCRSDLTVSMFWASAVSAIAMVKAMVFCMPKFPPIPALLQKTSGQCAVPGLGFPSSARGQILRYQTAYPPLEAGEAFGHQWLAAVAELGGLIRSTSASREVSRSTCHMSPMRYSSLCGAHSSTLGDQGGSITGTFVRRRRSPKSDMATSRSCGIFQASDHGPLI